MKKNTIHLIMGISSVGKSHYIKSMISENQWGENIPVRFANEFDRPAAKLPNEACVLHYNLLRPYDNDIRNASNDLLACPVIGKLLEARDRLQVTFLVAPRSILAKRVLLREGVETGAFTETQGSPKLSPTSSSESSSGGVMTKTVGAAKHLIKNILSNVKGARSESQKDAEIKYPGQKIFELLCELDLAEFHNQWFSFLAEQAISYDILDSSDSEYRSLSDKEEATQLLQKTVRPGYTDEEVKQIIESNHFEYQRIQVREGIYTSGQDRSSSMEVVTKRNFKGKSVLDVGCAYGFFSFEAESRGAREVLGTELKPHRFIGANILKEIKESNIRIQRKNVFEDSFSNSYDIILFLNVIHHLTEPIKALRKLAQICNETLIIEYPTLSDNKFQKTLSDSKSGAIDESLPLIGVSLLNGQDQTFLFSDEAIHRILTEHEKFFRKIEFQPSPISEDRRIAICQK